VNKLLPGKPDIHCPRLGSERRPLSTIVGRNDKLDKLELQMMKLINGEGFHRFYQGDRDASHCRQSIGPHCQSLRQRTFGIVQDVVECYSSDKYRHLFKDLEEFAVGIKVAKKNHSGMSLVHFYACQAKVYLLMEAGAAAAEAMSGRM
jgi:hypothetical protein